MWRPPGELVAAMLEMLAEAAAEQPAQVWNELEGNQLLPSLPIIASGDYSILCIIIFPPRIDEAVSQGILFFSCILFICYRYHSGGNLTSGTLCPSFGVVWDTIVAIVKALAISFNAS